MDTAAVGVAQKEDDEERIDEQDIFDGVVLFLAAITRGLLRRVLGADDAPFGPVMGTRGEAGAVAGMGATGVDAHMHQATLVYLMECLHPPENDPCSGPRRQAIDDSFCVFFFVCTAF